MDATNVVDTRGAAYEAIKEVAPTIGAQTLAAIKEAGGLTLDELAERGWLLQTMCGRISELRKQGLVRDSGGRRPTRNGRAAIVWEAV